jgi:hypothetical protein
MLAYSGLFAITGAAIHLNSGSMRETACALRAILR